MVMTWSLWTRGTLQLSLCSFRSVRQRCLEAVRRHVADPTVALAITLIGDGLYYDSALHGQDPELGVDAPPAEQLVALVELLERLATTTR